MASARPFQILPLALLLWLTTSLSHGLQLGETVAQIKARHGAPAVEDHARQLAVYYWAGWSAQLEFQNGVADKLTYRASHDLADAEIQSLLQANGGAARWRETTSPGAMARRWVRDDQAVAVTDAARAKGMIFQTVDTIPVPLAPAESVVTESVQKPDAPASSPTPAKEPAVLHSETGGPSSTPQPLLRSEPELRTEETSPGPATPPTVLDLPAAPPPVRTASPPVPEKNWRVLGGGAAGLALLGAALVWALGKKKSPEPSPEPATAPRAAPPAPPRSVATGAPDLGSLRDDQIELLLGEIFRRQGYTIEISAALTADGGSDLTLRRDGESIPVRSQDWKAARVTEREVRELYALMAGTAAPRGILVTTGGFSRDAREFAQDKSIELIDRSGLEERIAAVQRPEENFCDVTAWIGDFAAAARIFDPECPCCGQSMAIRRHRTDGTDSWVCATYPRCAGTRAARRDLQNLPTAA